MKWVCQSCGAITNADCPKFCCECGSRDLVKKERKSRDDRIAEYDSRLKRFKGAYDSLEEKLNAQKKQMEALKYELSARDL